MRAFLLVGLAVLLGLSLTAASYLTLQQNEMLRLRHDFKSLAEERIGSVEKAMSHYLQRVLATHALFDASEFVTRSEFERFVTTLIERSPGVRAIEWIPRVPPSELETYRDRARRDGFELRIKSVLDPSPAGPRETEDLYPVFYIAPQASNEAAFGLDLGSDPIRLEALKRARDTGEPAATIPLDLVQDEEKAKSVLIFVPYYEGGWRGDDVASRRQHLAGFVLGVFRMPDLLADATANLDRNNANVALLFEGDLLAGTLQETTDRKETIYARNRRVRHIEHVENVKTDKNDTGPTSAALASPLTRVGKVAMGGRLWTVVCTPTQQFLSPRESVLPLAALIVGLVLTALGAGFAYTTLRGAKVRDELKQSEQRYRTLVDHAPEGVLLLSTHKGGFVDANENACRMFGRTREELIDCSLEDISTEFQPNGLPTTAAITQAIESTLAGNTSVLMWDFVHSAGNQFPCEVRLVRLPASQDILIRGSITDISERVRSEERQALMMRELDHRVKNNLATVLSLTEQSAMDASSAGELRETLAGRIRALARLHGNLAQRQWTGMDLSEVFELTFAPYNKGHDIDRVEMTGPAYMIPADTCSALCMVVHELATNAVKYGALSQPGGTIEIEWRLGADGVEIDWLESGGPMLNEAPKTGYGTRLTTGLVEHELHGRIEREYAPSGFRCRIVVPLRPLGSDASASV